MLGLFLLGEGSTTVVVGPPIAPSNLRSTAVAQTTVDLAWNDNSDDETSFRLERKLTSDGIGSFVEVQTPAADATTVQDTLLTGATSYDYRIRARNASGDSAYSSTFTVVTSGAPAGPFTILPRSAGVLCS
jgi:hypothetical protein